MDKYVYTFREGSASMRDLLGGKGAGLAEMTNLGMPVPQGFTVTTQVCSAYYDNGETIPAAIVAEILQAVAALEKETGKTLGDPKNPLLVSVRSGAKVSMPGMMDTVLNLGLNDQVCAGMVQLTGNPRFVYDSYRRFIEMFADVVKQVDRSGFERLMEAKKQEKNAAQDSDLQAEDMQSLAAAYKAYYETQLGEPFPTDPKTQLMEAVEAVFRSWENPRAVAYRRMHDIPAKWGTAVSVQSMVFGNMGEDSGTGVAFSRDPVTGAKVIFGEFLMNAQGEDVVAGIRTPQPIDQLKTVMPKAYEQFQQAAKKLEAHYLDMQDIEFTIEKGKLYILQTRTGKRTGQAALKIAVDLVDEGKCTPQQAVLKVEPAHLDALLHPQFDPSELAYNESIGIGLPASPGAGCGKLYFNAEDTKKAVARGEKVVLVRHETSPEDIEGMALAQGVLTARGGMTSHAAVVARSMGICCVSGCSALVVREDKKEIELGGVLLKEGDVLSVDGTTGKIYSAAISLVPPKESGDFARFMGWADAARTLRVFANADSPKDAKAAKEFGAQGIGLCRTEHMFFGENRIKAMREMILSQDKTQKRQALAKVLPIQKEDFKGIFREMAGDSVTIRLLDPPLHEFLPKEAGEVESLAKEMGLPVQDLVKFIETMVEVNPMIGTRGCRLGVIHPEIFEMQTQAILEAALEVRKETGADIVPEIMVPLVSDENELKLMRKLIDKQAQKVFAAYKEEIAYKVGTMVETPRAALTAGEIAVYSDFFSFGTNDLTQLTFGFSRDDVGKILNHYFANKILEADPFATLDVHGVGRLMALAVKEGRAQKENLKIGVCGEHGGDPVSIEFAHQQGCDYVSCSPYRVPIARLAAAQAKIKEDLGLESKQYKY